MMLLSDFHPWPVLMPEPTLSDEELLRVPMRSGDLRNVIAMLIREKRAPAIYRTLSNVAKVIQDKIRELDNDSNSLENHLHGKRGRDRWALLSLTVGVQMAALLNKVPVTTDEIDADVTRWLILCFGSGPAEKISVEGREFDRGIMKPTAGVRR